MKKIALFLTLLASISFAALPPTSSKLSGETDYSTTFKFNFPHFAGTHNGTEVNLGILAPSGGGTGLNTLGAANSVLGVNNAGTALEYKGLSGTANQVNVTNGAGTITLSTPQDIATTSSPTFASPIITGDITLSDVKFDNEKAGDLLALLSSTGVRSGAVMSVNADPTKFDVAIGVGYVVDYSTPSAPTIKRIAIGPFTAQTVTNLVSADFTWVLVNSSGSLVQQATVPTATERRQNIVLGRLNHSNRTNLSFANTLPDVEFSPVSQFGDLVDSLGPFNISGNIITANGANLSMNKSAGKIFHKGFNYSSSTTNPHVVTTGGLTALSFVYQNQTGGPGSYVTVLDPTKYDAGGVTTTVPGLSNATVQRVYLFASNTFRVQRGQAVYSSFTNALQNYAQETFNESPLISGFAVPVAFIVITKSCTSLQNTSCAKIIPASKFGGPTGGGSGGSTTLQQAYLNSVQPQITLNSTQSGLELRDASTPIGVDLLSVKDNAGSRKYFSVGAGFIGVPQSSSAEIAAFPDQKGNLAYNTTNEKLTVHQNTGRDGMILTRGYAENLTLVNNDTLFLNLYDTDQTILVSGNSGPITLDPSAPFGFAGTKFNQLKFTLIGNSDTNTVTIPAGTAANTVLGYSVTLGRGQTATYQWNATLNQFVIISVSN